MSKPRVLITGGAGFLGSHLCERFLAEGYEVICMDNLITGDLRERRAPDGMPSVPLLRPRRDGVHPRRPGELDAVLHFASPASPIDYLELPIQTLKVGSLGTHKALGLARAKKARGSCWRRPRSATATRSCHPQTEDYWGNVNPVGPRGVYDEAKRFAEAMTMAYHRYHGVETRIVRIFNTYGPRMRLNDGRALPAFMSQALTGEPLTVFGDGSQTRSFCYVDDLVDGIFRLLNSDETLPTNIGNPSEMTILEFARQVVEITGSGSRSTYPRPAPGRPEGSTA